MDYKLGLLDELYSLIKNEEGILTKSQLENKIASSFRLKKERSVYTCSAFSIRFSLSKTTSFSNTVLALSTLKKYDAKPFIVCLVTPSFNYLYLANSSFLNKISHSSQYLSVANIKGSFNGSDIIKLYNGIENKYENFEKLFSMHKKVPFVDNLERLVIATNQINPTGIKKELTILEQSIIMESIDRMSDFMFSPQYSLLLSDLNNRIKETQSSIFKVVNGIHNVNKKGQFIEFLITSDDKELKNNLMTAINDSMDYPDLYTKDELGDLYREFGTIRVAIDVKSKDLNLLSNPKGYNLDKVLSFLSEKDTVFFMFFVGVDVERKEMKTKLVPIFDEILLMNTRIQKHWAGRNSRGVTQFNGQKLNEILSTDYSISINREYAQTWLEGVITL